MGRGMEMEGCAKFIQILMFISNVVIWVGSIILLVLGIWAVVDQPYLETILGNAVYVTAAYILISVGVLTFLISFLGCLGAIREIKCMLLTYFIIVLILFIVLLVGGILGLVFHSQAEEKIKMGMLQSMKEYRKGEAIPVTEAWDDAQLAMKCCGIDRKSDWKKNKGFKGADQVPKSCCKTIDGETAECTENPTPNNSFEAGCFEVSKDFVMKNAAYIGVAGIVIALLMIFGLVFSLILFKMIK